MRETGCRATPNNRNIMEAILWKIRTGSTWRDVLGDMCPWETAYNSNFEKNLIQAALDAIKNEELVILIRDGM